jgi:hypothetical protein
MFWTFVATIFAGLGAAGIALGIRAITAQKAPKWIIPAFAGAGMLAFLIYGDYTWYDLKRSQLPPEAEIVGTESDAQLLRPWTYLAPYVTAFSIVDTESLARDTGNPDVVRFTLYRFHQGYTDSVAHRVHLLNCTSGELVPLASDGRPGVDNMQQLNQKDQLFTTVCN